MTQGVLWGRHDRQTDADVAALTRVLARRGWATARELRAAGGWSDRELRALAHASAGRVISGQRGYCLIEEATVEEARHAAAWLRHQAEAMLRRSAEIERALHR
jgi:hypothetical protein